MADEKTKDRDEEFFEEENAEFLTNNQKRQHLEFELDFPTEVADITGIDRKESLKSEKLKEKTGWKRYAGVICALLAGISFTLATLIVKTLPHLHPINLSAWRHVGFILPSIPMALYFMFVKKVKIFSTVWPLTGEGKTKRQKTLFYVWLSSLFACTTHLLRFYSLKFLTLPDATVIAFSGPVCIVIFAHFCLGEKCGIVTIPIALWTLLGVFVIARPPVLTGASEFSEENLIGIALTLASVLFVALYFIIMRKLREVHLAVVSLMAGFMGFLEGLIIALAMGVFEVPEGIEDVLLTAAMAILSFMGQMFIVSALKWEQAGTVSLVRTSDVIFAFMWQLIFLDVIPDIFSYIGAVIVVIGVLLTTFRKWVSTLPKENRIRKIFGFLLK